LDRRDILREIFVGSGEIPRPPHRGGAFDTLCLTKKLELRTGDPDPPVVTGFVDDDQMDHAVGAVVWERIYQQAIDDAEDGGRRTDAQRERNDGRKGKAGLLAKLAEGEPKILQHILYTVERRKGYGISARVGGDLRTPSERAVMVRAAGELTRTSLMVWEPVHGGENPDHPWRAGHAACQAC